MKEYIERDKVIDEIDTWLDSVGTVLVGKGLSYYGELIGCVEDVPAADVAPVRHGRWVNINKDDEQMCKCSECGYPTSYFWGRTPICPNCGADLREDFEGGVLDVL